MRFVFACLLALSLDLAACAQQDGTWHFAVSGDSRNCGDIVMPAVAAKVKKNDVAFYWHLGDYRALYDFDQDMLAAAHGSMTISTYESTAWQDFTEHQLAAFGDVPVYLAIGNHEMIGHTRPELLTQFADWFNAPAIRAQRLKDNPADHALHGYYHWQERNVDFFTLDNASPDEFDDKQVAWFEELLAEDEANPAIRTVVLGMHDALPDSLTAGHSMNESPMGTKSGRKVYQDLVDFRARSGKEVQVLASHSHFVLAQPYATSCRKADDVLPGWVVGTGGAVRYRLPKEHASSPFAKTDVYGYLLATVTPEGHITFSFHEVDEPDVVPADVDRYGKDAVHACFAGNASSYVPEGPTCPAP
jgi:hypothetical protein